MRPIASRTCARSAVLIVSRKPLRRQLRIRRRCIAAEAERTKQLIQRRRFEAATGGNIGIPAIINRVFQRGRRQPAVIAAIAAVIRIAGGHVIVVSIEIDRAEAHAGA